MTLSLLSHPSKLSLHLVQWWKILHTTLSCTDWTIKTQTKYTKRHDGVWSNKVGFKDKSLQHTHNCFLNVSSIQWVAPHKKLNILSSLWLFSSALTKSYVVLLNCVRSIEQCTFLGSAKTFRTNQEQRNEHSRTSKKKEQKQTCDGWILTRIMRTWTGRHWLR
jgi:hypothetical protein